MNFKVIQRKNPQNLEMYGKFYPAPTYYNTIDLKSLANEISHSTSLTSSDVKAVIEELMIAFERHLVNGEKIRLDGIGIFKVSFSGEGAETSEAVTAQNIDTNSIRVTFMADSELKRNIRSTISFEKEKIAKKI